jgi:hypothetical protein
MRILRACWPWLIPVALAIVTVVFAVKYHFPIRAVRSGR